VNLFKQVGSNYLIVGVLSFLSECAASAAAAAAATATSDFV